ncbi:MAG: argininosuccinate lyase [Rickettsiales bacterium]|jgi:argininosuccinate lyase|nr:argininosuccinate lyase [Rickettsiales bacterium]
MATKKNKMWGGVFTLGPTEIMEKINASIDFDKKLYKYDILGSKVHAHMLEKAKIITKDDNVAIQKGLIIIEKMMDDGKFKFSKALEDIHLNVESKLKELIGEPAGKLHTARSRNDQVAVDFKLYVRNANDEIVKLLIKLEKVILKQSAKHYNTMLAGCTHLQVAQPTTFGHHLMAYFEMILRDIKRLKNARIIMNECPLGCAALCGTPFDINRDETSIQLNFIEPTRNSLDGVSDRDFAIEMLSCIAIISMHLSRFAEECIIWVSKPYGYVKIPEQYTSGSSIMPQKKNPDASELIRGKTGRIFGNLVSLLTMMKGLPLAYCKDMQEDKEPVFDSVENIILCIQATTDIIEGMEVNKENMLRGLSSGYPNATDFADYLVKKANIPFREAHHITGNIVKISDEKGVGLEKMPLSEMQKVCSKIKKDVFDYISIETSLNSRKSYGGTASENVKKAVEQGKKILKQLEEKI